jgi:GT2 family glycosyltransferase
MVSKVTIDLVGLPDTGFFIHGEDVDYSERIRKKGLGIKLVKHSKINHPVHESYEMNIFGERIVCYKEPVWKQYYDVRNRIVVAIRHRDIKLLTRTLPGSVVRLYGAMVREDRRMAHVWAFLAGTVDGLLGRMGRRHDKWHIN